MKPIKSIFLILILLQIAISPFEARGDPTQNDSAAWEIGENHDVTNFVKLTVNSVENASIFVEYQKFNLLGEEILKVENKSAGLFWKSDKELRDYQNLGAQNVSLTILGENINSIKWEYVYGESTTFYYYDLDTGLLMKSEPSSGDFHRLISWNNLDIKSYADEQNQFKIDFAPFSMIMFISFVGIVQLYILYKKKSVSI